MQPRIRALYARLDREYPGWKTRLEWRGDNSLFVVEIVLPLMYWLDEDVRQVIRWAYGYDGEGTSLEGWSDGSTAISDKFFLGRAKDPHGVGHDYLHRLSHLKLADPKRHVWTFPEAAEWYQRAAEQFGDTRWVAFWKRIGLDFFAPFVWGERRLRKTARRAHGH